MTGGVELASVGAADVVSGVGALEVVSGVGVVELASVVGVVEVASVDTVELASAPETAGSCETVTFGSLTTTGAVLLPVASGGRFCEGALTTEGVHFQLLIV